MVVDFLRIKKQLSRLVRLTASGGKAASASEHAPAQRPVSPARKDPRPSGLVRGRLTEAFFEPLPEDELAAWQQ
jgi:hypothetical protein